VIILFAEGEVRIFWWELRGWGLFNDSACANKLNTLHGCLGGIYVVRTTGFIS
jgi:hypothetical protein